MLTAITPTRMEARAPTSSSEATSRPIRVGAEPVLRAGRQQLQRHVASRRASQGVHTSDSAAAATSSRLSTAPITKLRMAQGALPEGLARPWQVRGCGYCAHMSLAFTRGSITA
jgi:hypothetical protein